MTGGINVCHQQSGQCLCKPSVGSRRCESCKDGSYNLSGDNLFGCSGVYQRFLLLNPILLQDLTSVIIIYLFQIVVVILEGQ